jgi:Tfp pilus assembly protein PilE
VPSAGQRRRRFPLLLVVVATVLAFLAIFALWANRQLLDNGNWTETSSELLENDAIRSQVSGFLVDELYAKVDVQGKIQEALPQRAAPLAGPLAGGLRELAERGANRALQRPRVQARWEEANRRAHAAFIKVINGGGDVVSTGNGDVVLDLKELLAEVQERVGVGGRAAEELPADAAQITILRSDQLGLAQDLVHFLEALAIVLVLVAIALYALAIYIARGWRREALRATGVGLVVAGAGALLGRSLAGDAVVQDVATTDAVRPAVEATWSIATSLLEEAAASTVGYGLVILVAAWLAGPGGLAVATRRALAPYLREPLFAYGGLAILVLVVLVSAPTPATRRVLPALFLVGLLVVGFEVLRRQTAREHP